MEPAPAKILRRYLFYILLQKTGNCNASSVMQAYRTFAAWPRGNSAELADLMIGASEEITRMHKGRKALVTDILPYDTF